MTRYITLEFDWSCNGLQHYKVHIRGFEIRGLELIHKIINKDIEIKGVGPVKHLLHCWYFKDTKSKFDEAIRDDLPSVVDIINYYEAFDKAESMVYEYLLKS